MSVLERVDELEQTAPGRSRTVRTIPIWIWATVVATIDAVAFVAVRPDVGDLQAALARESAARSGVGLTYWLGWFSGGSTPGNYSVITPALSAWFGAVVLGGIATVAITPLAWFALARLPHRVAGTVVATTVAGLNLWSGRIPFALGCAVGIVAIMAVRARRPVAAILATVLSSLCSPVTGAFVAFTLAAAFLVEREYRKLIFAVCAACGLTLLFVAVVFGAPGAQPYPAGAAFLTAASALLMLLARPHQTIRVALWCTAIAAPILAAVPNGMGSNFVRLPWICLPVAVVATAAALPRWRILVAILPAVTLCANATFVDLGRADRPSAAPSYYHSLIDQLKGQPGLNNYRLEVTGDPHVHTAAYALLGHAALAGGYETQEQNALNGILHDEARLNTTSYQVWLNNNAVGYIAFDRKAPRDYAEYSLVADGGLPYLHELSRSSRWILYRVADSTPIVPAPQRLLSTSQAKMRIRVTCACSFYVRIRYSKFLRATAEAATPTTTTKTTPTAILADDSHGWTIVTTSAPGIYVFGGDFTGPLR